MKKFEKGIEGAKANGFSGEFISNLVAGDSFVRGDPNKLDFFAAVLGC